MEAGFFVMVLTLEAQGLVDGGVVELEDAAPGLVACLPEAAAVGGIGLLGRAEGIGEEVADLIGGGLLVLLLARLSLALGVPLGQGGLELGMGGGLGEGEPGEGFGLGLLLGGLAVEALLLGPDPRGVVVGGGKGRKHLGGITEQLIMAHRGQRPGHGGGRRLEKREALVPMGMIPAGGIGQGRTGSLLGQEHQITGRIEGKSLLQAGLVIAPGQQEESDSPLAINDSFVNRRRGLFECHLLS